MDMWQMWKQKMDEEFRLHPGEHVLVAVSGGPDSMVLLHLLHRYVSLKKVQLYVAHIHHGFRPEESDQEQKLVVQYAVELGWPVIVGYLDLPRTISLTGENSQAAARRRRYDFLLRKAAEWQCSRIALAHHADDQAETVLSRLLKGSGTTGLSGMAPVRKERGIEIFRPLLSFSKKMILHYASSHHIRYAEDSSNLQTNYERNRIRLQLMPVIESHFPNAAESLARISSIMRDEHEYLDQIAGTYMDQHVHRTPNQVRFTRNSFLDLHLALQRRLILLVLSYLSPHHIVYDFHKIEQSRRAISNAEPSTLKLYLGQGIQFIREYDQIILAINVSSGTDRSFYEVVDSLPATIHLPESRLRLKFRMENELHKHHPTSHRDFEVYFDYDQLSFPLTVRSRKAGDRMRVKGLNGSKKVKDMFIDAKTPPSERNKVPLIIDGDDKVLWIPGVGISEWAAPYKQSKRILHIVCQLNIE